MQRWMNRLGAAALLGVAMACGSPSSAGGSGGVEVPQAAEPLKAGQAEAVFASGCFWCAESDFEKVDGVIDAVSGYAGGRTDNPTYKQVGSGATGHTEAIRVIYDPKKVTYEELLHHFWRHVDFFDATGQFCDRGSQYRPAIFPLDAEQRKAAEKSKAEIEALFGKPVALKLEEMGTFWVAESYHQDFYKTNTLHYRRYRTGCGRDRRVAAIWEQVGGPEAGGAK